MGADVNRDHGISVDLENNAQVTLYHDRMHRALEHG